MDNVAQEVLITREQLAQRVRELGQQITKDYEGEPVLLVGILRGSVPFMADIMREIDLDVTIDFMSVSSYGGSTKTSGVVRIVKDLETPIEGKNVIIIEDIIDTGLTLHYLKGHLLGRGPKSLKICAILDKPSRRKIDIKGDYIGFEVEDKFIVGYGLDFNQRYRQLSYISWLKE
ncbi:MAG: hypoxanthine phosphoribosyltransferase [Firmicutes bacterium]|nr:hypoxanthine phosphoribosyltransferase [Bacillota bacterium]MBR6237201.1 hypoxanthine phosphoribosyltransferase [Bacillota bacterium]